MLTVFTQIKFVADFLQAKCIFYGNRPFCVFEAPFGELRGNIIQILTGAEVNTEKFCPKVM